MQLQSALEHYRRQQRLTAAGLTAARRARFGTLDRLTATVASFQAVTARDAALSVPLMLAEQNIDAEPVATTLTSSLAGIASDGRTLSGLMDYTRSDDVTQSQFDLIVTTQLQDAARAAVVIAMATRPGVTGYVRMLNPPSCSRCAILAGKHFRKNQGFQRHPKCDCRHIPASEDTAGDLRTDPQAYFDSLPTRARLDELHPDLTRKMRREAGIYSQEDIFTDAGAQAIRMGADPGRVVNARAGMYTAQILRGNGDRYTALGRLERRDVFGRQVYTTTEGMTKRGAAYKARGRNYVRLMPESILEIADDSADALRLLRAHGYIT